jgi:demethylmenaquinone methyltransferase/2-methoxy-6-polyprenyl-1,4-benzoquinol methylase
MLAIARRKGVKNLVLGDALHLPFADQSFDAVTVAFGLRNMGSWSLAIGEMSRVLRRDGHLLILDFALPRPPLRWFYSPYLHRLLPRLATLLTGEKRAYEYLADSIEKFPQGESLCLLLQRAGFVAAKVEPLSGGIVGLYTAKRGNIENQADPATSN